MVRRQRHPLLDLQLVRQHVEQDFRIGIGVDVTAVVLEHLAPQFLGVHQVAVVRDRDAVGRVHVERLRLLRPLRTGRWVAAVADADASVQLAHRLLVEHVANQAVTAVQAQARAIHGGNAGRVLAAVLQDGQAVIKSRCHFGGTDNEIGRAHV